MVPSTWMLFLFYMALLKAYQYLHNLASAENKQGIHICGSGYVDIVRLLEVYINKGYVYCTLYFFTKNKILTVSEILNPDDYTIWRIMDNEEYDERMSTLLWQEVNKDDLLEFDD